jgi:hypothetical protein
MVGLTVLGAVYGLLLRIVLLLEDVEVGIDSIEGYWFAAKQFIEVLPFSL